MDEVFNVLSSPAWWISVFVAGVVINLLSSYLKTILDKRLSATSQWWRLRSDKQNELYMMDLDILVEDESLRYIRSTEALGRLGIAIFIIICSIGINLRFIYAIEDPSEHIKISIYSFTTLLSFASVAMLLGYTSSVSKISRAQNIASHITEDAEYKQYVDLIEQSSFSATEQPV